MRAQRRSRSLAALALLAAAALPAPLSLAGCAPKHVVLSAVDTTGRVVPVESLTVAYDVDGVRVIHRQTTATDVVAAHLYLLGGTRQLTPETAGIEAMLLGASGYGTRHYGREALRHATALTGSRVFYDPDADWTIFGFDGIRQEFDSSWAILADRLLHPALDSASVALAREHLVADARQRHDSPDMYLYGLADSVAYPGHPYALEPAGTEQSLSRITRETLERYHDEQLVTSRMLLVVVGNVSREQVTARVHETLGTLPRGSYRWTLPPLPARPAKHGAVLAMRERPLSTNYLLGVFIGPPASSPDYPAFRVATAVLSSRVNEEVRAKRSLSYAAFAPFFDRGVTAAGVYASTTAPEAVLRLVRGQLDTLRRIPVNARALHAFLDSYITDYYAENETNAAQADFLARAELYRGDYREAERWVPELRSVTTSEVARVARTYLRDVHLVYLGDPLRLPAEVARELP